MLARDQNRRFLGQFVALVDEKERCKQRHYKTGAEPSDLGTGSSSSRGDAPLRAGHGCLGLLHEVGKLSLIGVQGALGQPLQSLFEASDTLVTQLTPLQSDLGSDESEHPTNKDDKEQ